MRHPKTCNRCKALFQSQWNFVCELGYELNVRTRVRFYGAEIKTVSPKGGECPKPLTYEEMFNATKGAANAEH